jgi:hypothetical protein
MDIKEVVKLAEKSASHGVWIHPNGETAYTFYEENLEMFAKLIIEAERERLANVVSNIAGDDQYRWAAAAIRDGYNAN